MLSFEGISRPHLPDGGRDGCSQLLVDLRVPGQLLAQGVGGVEGGCVGACMGACVRMATLLAVETCLPAETTAAHRPGMSRHFSATPTHPPTHQELLAFALNLLPREAAGVAQPQLVLRLRGITTLHGGKRGEIGEAVNFVPFGGWCCAAPTCPRSQGPRHAAWETRVG